MMARQKSLKVLERKIKELQAEAEELQRMEKPGIRQLRAVLAKFKLGSADIKLAVKGRSPRVGGGSKLKGRKVKPKYRNPNKKSETWTGRGRMPLWMVALVKKGKKAADFAIK
jgi:DNA-binding protein H-NS